MCPKLLTNQQRKLFKKNGYLVVPNALTSLEIEALKVVGDQLMNNFDYDGPYAHRRAGLLQEKPFLALTTNEQTVPLIIALLGYNIHITNTALIYKHPQSPESLIHCNWHRDVGVSLDIGHKRLPCVGLKIGYCLTDFPSPDSGGTMFVSGSNHMETALPISRGETNPDIYEQPILKAGDAFLFESRTYHAPAPNYTNQIAKVVIFGYHYRWIKPDHYMRYYNNTLQPEDKLLEATTDLGRQLLGATKDSDNREAPDGIDWPIREWAKLHGLDVDHYNHIAEN